MRTGAKCVVIFHVLLRFGVSFVTVGSSSLGTTESFNTTEYKQVRRPCLDKYERLGTHTACLAASPNSTPIETTAEDIKLIVDTHNRYRSDVMPTAANMLKMSWDDEIAMIAQAWAENCSLEHDESHNRDIPGRLSLGQNMGDGYQTWTGVIDAWFQESYYFIYGNNNVFEKTGHYTQGVWADSNKIGCGASRCGDIIFYVCNYGPAGNIEPIQEPYKKGTACSECPLSCENKLCACGDLVCENGGHMLRDSCQCNCSRHPWLLERECQLNCSAVEEPWYCGRDPFDRDGCLLYENVPHDCPLTCEECPFGDWQYKEGSIPLFTTPSPHNENATTNGSNSGTSNGNNRGTNRPQGGGDTSAGNSLHWRHPHSALLALSVEVLLLVRACVPAGRTGSCF